MSDDFESEFLRLKSEFTDDRSEHVTIVLMAFREKLKEKICEIQDQMDDFGKEKQELCWKRLAFGIDSPEDSMSQEEYTRDPLGNYYSEIEEEHRIGEMQQHVRLECKALCGVLEVICPTEADSWVKELVRPGYNPPHAERLADLGCLLSDFLGRLGSISPDFDELMKLPLHDPEYREELRETLWRDQLMRDLFHRNSRNRD